MERGYGVRSFQALQRAEQVLTRTKREDKLPMTVSYFVGKALVFALMDLTDCIDEGLRRIHEEKDKKP